MDGEDGATLLTDNLKEDAEKKEPTSCPQQVVKVGVSVGILQVFGYGSQKSTISHFTDNQSLPRLMRSSRGELFRLY